MDKVKILNAIKSATRDVEMFFSGQVEAKELQFETVAIKGEDKSLSYAELVEGAEISISTAEGSEPAPDGTYEVDGDIKITVANGKISSIEQPEVAEDTAEEVVEELADEATESNADVEALKSEIESLKGEIEGLKDAIESIKESAAGAATKEDVSAFSAEISKLNEVLKVVIDTPVEFSKVDNSFEAKQDKNEKLRNIAAIASNLKKR